MLKPLIATLVCTASLNIAAAQPVLWPAGPVNPTSNSQCRALYEQYNAIRLRFRSEAMAFDCLRDASTGRGYDYAVLAQCEAEQRAAWDAAFDAGSRGARARNACYAQVRAHKAEVRASDDRDYSALLREKIAGGVLDGVLDTAKAELSGQLTATSPLFGAIRKASGTIARVRARVDSIMSRSPPGIDVALDRMRGQLAFNPLRDMTLDLAISSTRALHSAALDDFEAAMAKLTFEHAITSVLTRMDRQSQLIASKDPATIIRQGEVQRKGAEVFLNFDATRDQVGKDVRAAKASRGQAAKKALSASRRKSTSQHQSSATSSSRNNSVKCRQTVAQIREYERAISQTRANMSVYGSRGTQYISTLQNGIRGNQAWYNQNCR